MCRSKGKTKAARSKGQLAAKKAAGKWKAMTKKEKVRYKEGKRNADSDSDFSYRSVVSAGGTRHVMRRRKHDDGTYSAEESYHSSQDEDGEARRRRRRREREHEDSDHSYYSVVSEGGTRHVRRRRRHEDGTYSASESYQSPSGESESDLSYASEVSEGGTRHQVVRKRIRDADGNVIGYGEAKPVKDGRDSDAVSDTVLRGSIAGSEYERRGKDGKKQRGGFKGKSNVDEDILNPTGTEQKWPGGEGETLEKKILQEDAERLPSDFSDATTDDDIDLSKLTPAQRRQYLAEKEKRRKAREKRRREKYGDKYDEIMQKKNAKKMASLAAEQDKLLNPDKDRRFSSSQRRTSSTSNLGAAPGRPKSMVTYEKGAARDTGYDMGQDNREHGLKHDDWGQRKDGGENKGRRRRSIESDGGGEMPRLHRETTMLKPVLPTITQGKVYHDGDQGKYKGRQSKGYRDDDDDRTVKKDVSDNSESKDKEEKEEYFEVGEDGKLILKKKKIDLDNITRDELIALGIDPNLSAKEIAKRLKKMFGKDVVITEGGKVIGTRGIHEYGSDVSESDLAKDDDLDLDTLSGLKRVNLIMRRGGSALRRHLQNIIQLSRMGKEQFAKDLDERGADIDFLSHYRLVDPSKIETYARAFVVEDSDLDAVINSHETRVALDGVPTIQQMTQKQVEYVMKVLHIDEASLVTFRMFAVITALCERVTNMDVLSQRLLEICNLADVERKLALYKAMFYHNIRSDHNSNFITSDSLKIELIAGGLNWNQQEYIMEKMEANDWGEISFLDYMCYIPLFMSMHDNICDNPLDMSNQKYTMPPRQRPPSVQRDMNPLGYPLQKKTALMIRKQALELMEGNKGNARQVSSNYLDMLKKFNKDRLPKIDHRSSTKDDTSSISSDRTGKTRDLIF